MEDSDTIFVLIPSYRDPELPHTLYSLFETAADSSRVFVGVYEQEDVDAPPLELSPRWRQQVRVHRVPWTLARGPCFARAEAAKLYAGERFVLYLDSHMRMAVHWDSLLLEQWRMCQSDRAILTTYPVGYEMGFEGGTRHWSDAKVTTAGLDNSIAYRLIGALSFSWIPTSVRLFLCFLALVKAMECCDFRASV